MKEDTLVLHESEVEEKDFPGRKLRWLVRPEINGTKNYAVNMVRLSAGAIVKPAHSHQTSEEIIYIIEGEGEVLIDGKVYAVRKGSVVVFPQKSIHMVRNAGNSELRIICFFAPPTDTSQYTFHEEVVFPGA
ncbi:MAG: cupin domain-containing protein [Spirochaetales bacterium]|nr:cupin domain-containing protein [Spirochaetales bacterium]